MELPRRLRSDEYDDDDDGSDIDTEDELDSDDDDLLLDDDDTGSLDDFIVNSDEEDSEMEDDFSDTEYSDSGDFAIKSILFSVTETDINP